MEYSALKPDEPVWYNRGMPAKDMIHDAVRHALEKDGWTITHEYMRIDFEDAHVYIDLGAERLLIAERSGEKVAVEIKSFVGRSAIQDMEDALGQFVVYRTFLRRIDPERYLLIGISHIAFDTVFQSKAIQTLVDELSVSLVVVNTEIEEVQQWIRK